MVVSGLPIRNGEQHVIEIAKMSQAILNEVKSFKIKHLPERQLKIRIGLHSGMSKWKVIEMNPYSVQIYVFIRLKSGN